MSAPDLGSRRAESPPAAGRLYFEGRAIAIHPGDTVWSCLWRAGVVDLRTTKTGAARGAFCGIGVCHECLVAVGDLVNARACLVPATDGMIVSRTDWSASTGRGEAAD